jgi:F0F1-type ATP synthase membrane subunit c/vacuolar-type H+-ATPase subunit K
MPDPKANFNVVTISDDLIPTTERQERDSLFKRRLIGVAFIVSLVLLGLAFPIVI